MDNYLNFSGDLVLPRFSHYEIGNNLALILEDESGWTCCVVTVNLPEEKLSNERCAFIDVNNCGSRIMSWLELNNFGKFTNRDGLSGFCVYPEFEFAQEIIDKYSNKDIVEDILELKEV